MKDGEQRYYRNVSSCSVVLVKLLLNFEISFCISETVLSSFAAVLVLVADCNGLKVETSFEVDLELLASETLLGS